MLKYPDVRRDETFHEDYHGHKVHDPYRWLEDPDSEETKKFVEEQNNVTVPFLNEYSKKSALLDRLTEMWNYPKFTCPFKRGERFYYFMNTGLQNQNVLYVQDSLDGEPRIFFDQNALSEDGTVALHSYKFSENGKLFAYALSDAGSDWVTIRVKDVETDKDLSDVLHRVKFSCIAWTHDNLGFFYNRYAEDDGNRADGRDTGSNLNQKLYYHRLGAEQSEDVLCAEFPDEPKWMSGVELSDCGRYVLLSISEGCDPVNRLWYCDRNQLPDGIKGLLPWVKLVDNFDAEYDYTTNNGSLFAFKTNLKAPRCKVITIDFDHPEQENWKDLVPEHEKDVLDWAACVNQTQLILCYMHDVKNELFVHDVTTGERIAQFPLEIGSIMGYSGKKKDDVVFFLFTSFLTPGTIYTCDMKAAILEPKIFRQIEVRDFDNTQFETRQVFYTSKDGTRIPMFLTCSKTMAQNGENPVLLYGYGGFNISITPYFSVSWIVFMKHFGGIFAVANIRGGGEYGEDWHKAGSLGSKQNCFDDFHAAAEYLVSEKYSKPSKIAISGGSNGGLLVAACANQRPELFGSVVAHVGVMDMLRFHKFTIGHAWTTDFGCSDLEEQYHWQIKYSPVHNIPNKPYPATILFTGDHDDRVVPLHSFKFIAQLQHQLGAHPDQTNPLLIRIDTRSGHGAGKPTSKKIEEAADQLNFIVQTLHVDGVF